MPQISENPGPPKGPFLVLMRVFWVTKRPESAVISCNILTSLGEPVASHGGDLGNLPPRTAPGSIAIAKNDEPFRDLSLRRRPG